MDRPVPGDPGVEPTTTKQASLLLSADGSRPAGSPLLGQEVKRAIEISQSATGKDWERLWLDS